MAIGRKLVRTSKPLESQAVLTLFLERGGNENVNLDQTTRLLGISLFSRKGSALVASSRTHCHLVNHLTRFNLTENQEGAAHRCNSHQRLPLRLVCCSPSRFQVRVILGRAFLSGVLVFDASV